MTDLKEVNRFRHVMDVLDHFLDYIPLLRMDVNSRRWDNNVYNLMLLQLDILTDNTYEFEHQLIRPAQANLRALKGFYQDGDINLCLESIRIAERQIRLLYQRLSE